jgi:hypothetical protein
MMRFQYQLSKYKLSRMLTKEIMAKEREAIQASRSSSDGDKTW